MHSSVHHQTTGAEDLVTIATHPEIMQPKLRVVLFYTLGVDYLG